MAAKPTVSATKRDNSVACVSFQETNPSKLQKEDTGDDFPFQSQVAQIYPLDIQEMD